MWFSLLPGFVLQLGAQGCDLESLYPLQLSLGHTEVQTKIQKIHRDGLEDYQNKTDDRGSFTHHLKVLVGPPHPNEAQKAYSLYLVDGHHDASAYLTVLRERHEPLQAPCTVERRLDLESEALSFGDFILRLEQEELLWPYTASGIRLRGNNLVQSFSFPAPSLSPLDQLRDDPCRSFIYRARKYFEDLCDNEEILYARSETPFQEFYYANFARDLGARNMNFRGCESTREEDYEFFRQHLDSNLPGVKAQDPRRPCGRRRTERAGSHL